MRRTWIFLSLLALAFALAGCPRGDDDDSGSGDDDDMTADDDDMTADDDDATADDDDSTAADDDDTTGGDDDDSAGGMTVSGLVIDGEGDFEGMPGATVQSVGDPSTAVTTDAAGLYGVDVPLGEYAVEAISAGRYTVVSTGHTDDIGGELPGLVHVLMSPTTVADMIGPLGTAQTSTDGMIWLSVMGDQDQPAGGASTSIGAASAGSVQVGESGAVVGSAVDNDTFIVVYVNVPPGESTITVTPPSGQTCVGPASTVVFADKASAASFVCE